MSASHGRRVALVGLGYVGLPVAVALGRIDRVVAYDIDAARLNSLRTGHDHTGEVSDAELAASSLQLTSDAKDLQQADFFIIAVPTPVDLDRRPDLSAFLSAAETVAGQLKPGDIVVFESTVYPGATEEDAVPVLERRSGLKLGSDFAVGYSPERINPGDRQHSLESVVKVISASDAQALDVIAGVYGSIVQAGVYRAPSIRVAEAAKVIENTQRDLNIALINELALIFHRLGIDTGDVLAAAGTKWNFLPFRPGLVGGHCIGVDPYYLTHKAQRSGYHPELVLAGRHINDTMHRSIAHEAVRLLMNDRTGPAANVVVLGLTFKENVPDVRNSRSADLVHELTSFGLNVHAHDPVADPERIRHEMNLTVEALDEMPRADAVILAVAHQAYRDGGWAMVQGLLKQGTGLVMDLKGVLDRSSTPAGVRLWRL
jgi:UDP-N-acetyl-D-glucosamine/UDP-N-acetyl-D-galactosamine dehydrogenase